MLKGFEAIRQLFTTLVKEFEKPGASFQMLRQDVDGDIAYILWKAETTDLTERPFSAPPPPPPCRRSSPPRPRPHRSSTNTNRRPPCPSPIRSPLKPKASSRR